MKYKTHVDGLRAPGGYLREDMIFPAGEENAPRVISIPAPGNQIVSRSVTLWVSGSASDVLSVELLREVSVDTNRKVIASPFHKYKELQEAYQINEPGKDFVVSVNLPQEVSNLRITRTGVADANDIFCAAFVHKTEVY